MQSTHMKLWNVVFNSWVRSIETVDGVAVDEPKNA